MPNQYTVDRTCMCCGTKKNTIRMRGGSWDGKYLCGECLEAEGLGNMLVHGLDPEYYLRDYFKRKGLRMPRRKV